MEISSKPASKNLQKNGHKPRFTWSSKSEMLTCIWVNKRSLLLGGYEEMWQGFFLVSKSIGPELPHRSMEFGWLSVTLCRQTKSSLLTTKTRRFPYWHRSVGYVRFTNPYLKSYLPTFSRIHHKQVFLL